MTASCHPRGRARRAARKHGQPAIAAAFDLIHLEPKRRKAPSPEPPAPEPPTPGPAPVTAAE